MKSLGLPSLFFCFEMMIIIQINTRHPNGTPETERTKEAT